MLELKKNIIYYSIQKHCQRRVKYLNTILYDNSVYNNLLETT